MADIGKLYDAHVATTYDADRFGLLAGGRSTATAQIDRRAAELGDVRAVVDLALGTGESILAIRDLFPGARLYGIDIAAAMIEIARRKLDVTAFHDDALSIGRHLAAASVDLALAHFVTTYVDASALLGKARDVLRPGGHVSLVSGVMDAWPNLQAWVLRSIPRERLLEMSPAPLTAEHVAAIVREQGFEIVEMERFRRSVRFASFEDFYDFGFRGGFFTHVFDALGPDTVAALASLDGVFPLEDRYEAAVILAKRR
jgi:S-adenosylmethionine-diacylgycerolhomoserine-N-methlytransferase